MTYFDETCFTTLSGTLHHS